MPSGLRTICFDRKRVETAELFQTPDAERAKGARRPSRCSMPRLSGSGFGASKRSRHRSFRSYRLPNDPTSKTLRGFNPKCGLVRTKTEEPMQVLAETPFFAGHAPHRRELDHQRGAGAVKEGSGSYRFPTLAGLAPEPTVAHPPMIRHPASGTQKTIRPSKPLQVDEAHTASSGNHVRKSAWLDGSSRPARRLDAGSCGRIGTPIFVPTAPTWTALFLKGGFKPGGFSAPSPPCP